MYKRYGGNMEDIEKLVNKYGVTLDTLRDNYNALYGRGNASASNSTDAATIKSYAEEIAKYCEIANELASLSPDEYAKRSDDEKMIDSMLNVAIEYYSTLDPDLEYLKDYANYKKLDKARTERLGEEYERNNQ